MVLLLDTVLSFLAFSFLSLSPSSPLSGSASSWSSVVFSCTSYFSLVLCASGSSSFSSSSWSNSDQWFSWTIFVSSWNHCHRKLGREEKRNRERERETETEKGWGWTEKGKRIIIVIRSMQRRHPLRERGRKRWEREIAQSRRGWWERDTDSQRYGEKKMNNYREREERVKFRKKMIKKNKTR